MAGVNNPFGLKPLRKKDGSPYNGAFNVYQAPSTYATALYVGDPVIITGTADTNGTPEVNVATAGATNKITGIIVGFLPTFPGQTSAPDLNVIYGKASTTRYIAVCDDPDMIFEIVPNFTVAVTDVGTNCNIASGSGSTTTGLSGYTTATATPTTDATYQLTIERIAWRPDNSVGANAHLEVSINLHQKMSYAIAGI